MDYRDIPYQRATGKGRPVECVNMNHIELGTTTLQLEKELEKEVGLRKETRVRSALP
jgi:hypothetical protein